MQKNGVRKSTRNFRRGAIVPLMRFVSALLSPLPRGAILALGKTLGLYAWLCLRTERRRAIKNLGRAFPALPGAEVEALARRVFDSLAMSLLEMLVLHRWSRENLSGLIENFDDMKRLIRESRSGAVLVTGHVGNWELLAATFARHGGHMNVVGKRMREDGFDDFLTKLRGASGLSVLYTDESPRAMLSALRGGVSIGILPDQDITEVEGVFVDFFGRPAHTPSAPAKLAIMSGKPIYVALLVRSGKRFRLVLEGPIRPQRPRGREERKEEALRLTRAWSAILEDTIRRHPDQWVWMHRRWRNTPERLEWRRSQLRAGGTVCDNGDNGNDNSGDDGDE